MTFFDGIPFGNGKLTNNKFLEGDSFKKNGDIEYSDKEKFWFGYRVYDTDTGDRKLMEDLRKEKTRKHQKIMFNIYRALTSIPDM